MGVFISLFMACLIFCPMPVWAQEKEDKAPIENYLARPYYEAMAREAQKRQPDFRFGFFRGRYALAPQYDPLGEAAQARLFELALTVRDGQDAAASEKALADYNKLVFDHLAHIGIVSAALTLAQDDARFGDPKFYRWMLGGLLRSVKESGDGGTLRRAYDAVTLAEETYLLKSLGVKVLETQTRQEGILYYNMHRVLDPKTQQERIIFVDITPAMRHLKG